MVLVSILSNIVVSILPHPEPGPNEHRTRPTLPLKVFSWIRTRSHQGKQSYPLYLETSGQFAKMSIDYLVDMLNDEIEEVRLQAINCCCRLAPLVPVLLEDQLENVLTSCLPDARQDIRSATHRLLAECALLSRQCLDVTILELLKSLEKYPNDQYSIYKAFRDLGKFTCMYTVIHRLWIDIRK